MPNTSRRAWKIGKTSYDAGENERGVDLWQRQPSKSEGRELSTLSKLPMHDLCKP